MTCIILSVVVLIFPVIGLTAGDVISESDSLVHKYLSSDLISAGDLKLTDPDYIHLGVIISNIGDKEKNLIPGIVAVFKSLLQSIFHYSEGSPLHLIIITDQSSKDIVEDTAKQSVGKYLSESVIYTGKWDIKLMLTFPRLFVEFVDLASITEPNRVEIDTMIPLYSYNTEEVLLFKGNDTGGNRLSPKYIQDLFYIGPFYSRAFTSLNRLIVFDVDLIIKTDLAPLNKYFDDMKREEIIGITVDQLNFYRYHKNYIKENMNMTLKFKDAAMERGLNTGVVLYNLEKIRKSEKFQEELKPENFKKLVRKFGFNNMIVGDQDWLTLMMWTYPELFKVIPCEYNMQVPDIKSTKSEYCDENPKILHTHSKIHEDPDKPTN